MQATEQYNKFLLSKNIIYNESCETGLSKLPDNSINCCVTSPPYYGLRDYGCDDQIGLENSPELYVERLVNVFREVKRVLRDDGTLWLNLGDTYYGHGNGSYDKHSSDRINGKGRGNSKPIPKNVDYFKPKDLVGIPWMVAFAIRADGWYLRQDIIWSKPNPMPESVTDRCTKAHEYIFLLSKSAKYYYDYEAIKQPVADQTILRMQQQIDDQIGSTRVPGKNNVNMKAVGPGRNPRKGVDTNGGNQASANGIPAMAINGNGVKGHSGYFDQNGNLIGAGMANKKSVWTVTTKPFRESHFATFPPDLIVDCIKAGCPEGGVILDPFMGAGTTAVVSRKLNRNYVGFELNLDYVKISERRIYEELGIFQ
jgi:DNA modification methylase